MKAIKAKSYDAVILKQLCDLEVEYKRLEKELKYYKDEYNRLDKVLSGIDELLDRNFIRYED